MKSLVYLATIVFVSAFCFASVAFSASSVVSSAASSVTSAVPSSAATTKPTASVMAIRSTYAGGQDEDDLSVQDQLYEPAALLDRDSLNAKVIRNVKHVAQ